MAFRIRALFFSLTSACAIGTVLFLMREQGVSGMETFSAWGALFLLSLLVERILRMVIPEWVSLILAAYVLTAFAVCDALHFSFFRAHLDTFAMQTAYVALSSGQVHLDTWIYLWYVLWSAVWLLASFLLLKAIRRNQWPFPSKAAAGAALIFVVPSVVAPPAAGVMHPALFLQFAESTENKEPIRAGEFHVLVEREQFRRFEQERASILASLAEPKSRPNILFVHIESLRSDAWQVMPKLSAIAEECLKARRCLRPAHHYGTGNNSGTGVFGLLTGLNGYYFHIAKRLFSDAFPLQALKKFGYKRSFYTATDWDYDDLFTLFFERTMDHVVRNKPSKDVWSGEKVLFDQYIQELSSDTSGIPRFDYLVWFGTHYSYYYPDEYELSQPAAQKDLPLMSGKLGKYRELAEGLRNRYWNSARYADDVFAGLIERLQGEGRLANTIVVLFGDHGEEFWEKGRFGHTFGFSQEQTETFFLALFPEEIQTQYRYTSHSDVMPTIFDVMGIHGNFMTGKSLREYDAAKDFALVSMGILLDQVSLDHMIVGDERKVWFRNKGAPRPLRVTDLADNAVHESGSELLQRALRAKTLLQ